MGKRAVVLCTEPFRVTARNIARVLGLPGKPEGVDGGAVEHLFRDGRHKDISDYCRSDVINTYRAWLRYELFRGALGEVEFAASEADFAAFAAYLGPRVGKRPTLASPIQPRRPAP